MGRAGVETVSAAALRRQRDRSGLSVRQLAALSGVGATTINGWEAGRRAPSARLLAAVADALQVTVADLVVVPAGRIVVADLRHRCGLSQRAAADATGMSPSMYEAIESGFRAPDPAQRALLAAHLRVCDTEFTTVWERTRTAYRDAATRH